MAYLLSESTRERIYLKNYHSFGRLQYSVNTFVAKKNISRIHAVIEWTKNAWFLKDLSTNGVWHNNQRLQKEECVKLTLKDQICFAKDEEFTYSVEDLSAPCDFLLRFEPSGNKIIDAYPLEQYTLIPNDSQPVAAVFYEANRKSWFVEQVNEINSEPVPIDELSQFKIGLDTCQLQLNDRTGQTELLSEAQYQMSDIGFEFRLSQDEESTQMLLILPDKNIDFDIRSHHYLTLNLARKLYEDIQANVNKVDQGWIYADMLAKDIGVDANYLNIQIFRARKQFMDLFAGLVAAEEFIQRRAGKIRFGGMRFLIKKGTSIECQSPKP